MKILDNNFRRELYKNLVDAGYDNIEAQKIVSVKWIQTLKDIIIKRLTDTIEGVKCNDFSIEKIDTIKAEMLEALQALEKLNPKSEDVDK